MVGFQHNFNFLPNWEKNPNKPQKKKIRVRDCNKAQPQRCLLGTNLGCSEQEFA